MPRYLYQGRTRISFVDRVRGRLRSRIKNLITSERSKTPLSVQNMCAFAPCPYTQLMLKGIFVT